MSNDELIRQFNEERGLLEKGFNLTAELNMIEEELQELRDAETVEAMVDALADIRVLVTGGILKLGYDPRYVMMEVLTEILNRSGTYNKETGKWEKDDSLSYRADFTNCKLKDI